MKKVGIATILILTLGIPSSARAFNFGAGVVPFPWKPSPQSKSVVNKSTAPQHYLEIIELLKQLLQQTKTTHQSITENRQLGATKTGYTSFFLKNPELVYSENNNPDISVLIAKILQLEKNPASVQESRDTIAKRTQYTAVVDKAISLKTFQDAENRFQEIGKLLNEINKTKDLKGIAELQARIKGMLAMIQNETAKLQMVTYSRNAEQALINQQKQMRNMKILNSKNQNMPIIRAIR